MKLIIHGRLDGLNEYTKANRTNQYVGNNMKKNNQKLVVFEIKKQKLPKVNSKINLRFDWYEPNRRRDKDNICSAKKFILDALVVSGIIKSDGWNCVEGFTDNFYVDPLNPRVEVEIVELQE